MRLEGNGKGRLPVGAAHPQGGIDHRAVSQMNAVEIAHGDHGPAGDLGGRGGVSDNGKTSCHFRGSAGILRDFSELLGLLRTRPGRDAVLAPKSSGAARTNTPAIRSTALHGPS